MSARGTIATMTVEAATDAEILLAYLDHVLCPQLEPGQVVIMDNLSAHQVTGVRERSRLAGHPCSTCRPTRLTSILSKKHGAGSNNNCAPQARTATALNQATAELLPNIRPQDATEWFRLPLHPLQ